MSGALYPYRKDFLIDFLTAYDDDDDDGRVAQDGGNTSANRLTVRHSPSIGL